MQTAGKGRARLLVAAAATGLILVVASQVQARPEKRFYAGVGLMGSRISGDVDGKEVLSKSPQYGPDVYLGKLDNGGGFSGAFGMVLGKYLAVELNIGRTGHDATHEALPGRTFSATVSSFAPMVRGMFPLGDSYEIFALLGPETISVEYEENAQLPPNPTYFGSQVTGTGGAGALGFAWYFADRLGAEVVLMREDTRLRSVTAADQEFEKIHLDFVRGSAQIRVTYHFKDR